MRDLELFLSYARQDASAAEVLRKQLEAAGHRVWQDTQELLAGDSFETHIRRTLAKCDGYVVLVTPRSLASAWVLIELGGAWVGGLEIYPVVADTSRFDLPGPLRNLNCCSFDEVEKSLLPALARLHTAVNATSQIVMSDESIVELAGQAVAQSVPPDLRGTVVPLVVEALSPIRVTRRLAHTAVQQCPQYARRAFLDTMLSLTGHADPRIRGEAFYCLGHLAVDGKSYLCDESFFRSGLRDDSVFVQACCANILKNFTPLETETAEILLERLGSNVFRVGADEHIASLVYYCSITLGVDRAQRVGGTDS